MKTVYANIKPELLIWARESIHIQQNDIKKDFKNIDKWEIGEKKPTFKQLQKLAEKYKRPTAFFYLPKAPEQNAELPDFRTPIEQNKNPLTKEMYLSIRRVKNVQDISKELINELDLKNEYKYQLKKISINDDPEKLSLEIRDIFKISLDEQKNWKDETAAFYNWRNILEKNNVLVMQEHFPIEESRGFAIFNDILPIICVNIKDSFNGRIFSIFHELSHILLSQSGISDLNCYESQTAKGTFDRQEIFCNHFAGAFLLPKREVDSIHKIMQSAEWGDNELSKIARKYKVSRETILRRLLNFDYISEKYYQKKRQEYLNEKKKKGFSSGGRNFAKECVHNNSSIYINLVNEGFKNNKITYLDMAHYLKLAPKYLPEIEKQFAMFGNEYGYK